jgi:hypothetical protein
LTGQIQRGHAPDHPVLEVRRQPGLVGCEEGAIPEARPHEDAQKGTGSPARVDGASMRRPGFVDEGGERQPGQGQEDAGQKGCLPAAEGLGEISRGCGREGNAPVPRPLVQRRGEAAIFAAGEVDLEHNRHRPAEPLLHPEKDVCTDHPAPPGCQDKDDRDRDADEPPGREHAPSPETVREPAGCQVGQHLGRAEGDEECGDRAHGVEVEPFPGHFREDAALQPDHRPDKGVDRNQQGELPQIGPDPLLHVAPRKVRCGTVRKIYLIFKEKEATGSRS